MSTDTATVETLTAEVRVLMVGNRQITLSVAKQLDRMDPYEYPTDAFEPFGRVRTGIIVQKERKLTRRPAKILKAHSQFGNDWYEEYQGEPDYQFVGRRVEDGALVLYVVHQISDLEDDTERQAVLAWDRSLPLIVLAGLK